MAKRTLTNPQGLDQIYSRRQPRRPHYLREWMERRHIETQAELVKEIGADKGLVSRWLDEDNPSTPGIDWQAKLGAFFGTEDDPIDIFQHPDDDWFSRLVRRNTSDTVRRAIQILEAAGITPDSGERRSKSARRS